MVACYCLNAAAHTTVGAYPSKGHYTMPNPNIAAANLLATLRAANVAYTATTVVYLLQQQGVTLTRQQAYAVRHAVRRAAYNVRRLRRANHAHHLAKAVSKVRAHSMAQYAAAQRYGFNW